MSAITPPPPRVSQLAWLLINLTHRYRAVSLDLSQAFLPQFERDTLRRAYDRLAPAGWMVSTRLEDGQPCYALGRRGQRWFALRSHTGFCFNKDALLQHVGIATFCALAGFRRLLPGEFKNDFPQCNHVGFPAQNYCVDESNPGHLAWIIVDHVSDAHRFHGKLSKVISRWLPLTGFQELLNDGRLQLVVLTATDDKAAQIRGNVGERCPLTAPVSVVAIPSLLQFML